jgi:YggT family protein
MIAIFYLVLQLLKLYYYIVLANVVISWLVAFNILNTQNRFVYSILEMTYRLTDPILNKIRGFLPNLGSLDISPVILLVLIWFIEMCMHLYIKPMIFLRSLHDFNRWKKNSS